MLVFTAWVYVLSGVFVSEIWWESGLCRPGGHFCFMFSLTHAETRVVRKESVTYDSESSWRWFICFFELWKWNVGCDCLDFKHASLQVWPPNSKRISHFTKQQWFLGIRSSTTSYKFPSAPESSLFIACEDVLSVNTAAVQHEVNSRLQLECSVENRLRIVMSHWRAHIQFERLTLEI